MAIQNSGNNLGRNAASALMRLGGKGLIVGKLNSKDEKTVIDVMISLRGIGSSESIDLLENVAFDQSRPTNVRREAASAMGASYSGEDRVLDLLREDKFPDNLKASAVNGLSRAWRRTVRLEAANYLQNSEGSDLPPINALMAMTGVVENGKTVFKNSCAICHQVGEEGMDFGPKLTEIGSKLSKEAQYIAIIHPDAGISFGYEGQILKTKDGNTYGGIISSRTETELELKMPGGTSVSLKTSDIASIEQMENSMMPAGLERGMTAQEMVDLVEYLMSLKKISSEAK
jgi:putative heme-binding domain-containing protein